MRRSIMELANDDLPRADFDHRGMRAGARVMSASASNT
jgi:hypothetical protein